MLKGNKASEPVKERNFPVMIVHVVTPVILSHSLRFHRRVLQKR